MKRPSIEDYRLYFVTDSKIHRGYSVSEQVELALKGGVRMIQVREKELAPADIAQLASKALELTRKYNAFLFINDWVEVAQEVNVDGIHLGQDDMPIREARKLLGKNRIIGISVKTPAEAIKAQEDGADYLAVNGVFYTQTKNDLGDLPGLEGVSQIRHYTRIPLIAIGGINLQNCHRVIEAGADGIAVVSAISTAEDIPATCRKFLNQLEKSLYLG